MILKSYRGLELPSNRKFGLFFTAVFAAIALYLFLFGEARGWAQASAAVAALLLAVTLLRDGLLQPFNWAWMALGHTLGLVIRPIVLGVIFFGLLTPFGLIGRLLGRDELGLRKRDARSYWKERDPVGPEGQTFLQQF